MQCQEICRMFDLLQGIPSAQYNFIFAHILGRPMYISSVAFSGSPGEEVSNFSSQFYVILKPMRRSSNICVTTYNSMHQNQTTKLQILEQNTQFSNIRSHNNNNSVALVRERTIPAERQPLAGEVSVNFCGYKGCRVVSATELYGRNLGILDRRGAIYKINFANHLFCIH
jgi:hypothetical protein